MQVRENISLRPYNTFGIAATARYFATFATLSDLEELYRSALLSSKATLVLGGGSNLLLTGDFDGVVLKNEIDGITVVQQDDEVVDVKAGAGVNWHRLVMYCVENGFAGMENLALIPGSVGASPMQNIGAYGVEVKDIFHSLEAYHINDGVVKTFTRDECKFGYRDSVFKHALKGQYIITGVTYRLTKKCRYNTSYGAIQQELDNMGVQELSLKAVAQAVINIRTSKLPDPKEVGNAGSFFKNPVVPSAVFETLQAVYPSIPFFPADEGQVKLPAGWLIEQCGWKGYRNGDAGCYPKQALVLVNYGAAKGEEIYALSEAILQSVLGKFGIRLEREVNVV